MADDNVVRIDYVTLFGPAHVQWRRCSVPGCTRSRRTVSSGCNGLHDAELARRMRKVLTSLRKAGALS